MNPAVNSIDHGVPYRSKNVAWAASQGQNDFPVDFLDPAIKGMDNPYIQELFIRLSITKTTAATTGSARGLLDPQMITRILIKDEDGVRVDCKGSSLRAQIQMEEGTGFGYADMPNQGAGASLTEIHYLMIPICHPKNAENGREYRWDARKLRNGGQITLDFSAAAVGPSANYQQTITAGTVEIHATVVDEHRPVEKVRGILREWTIYAADQTFPLGADNGTKTVKVRSVLQYIGDVGEDKATQDTWAAQNITSRVLQYYSVRDDYLIKCFRTRRPHLRPDPNGIVPSSDCVDTGVVLPLFVPNHRQQITELPDCGSFDWRTDLTFGSGTFVAADLPKMIFTYIEDRPGTNPATEDVKLHSAGQVASSRIQPKLRGKLPAVKTA